MAKVTLSDESKALMSKRGWDKGYVVFGAPPSESTVKVLTAANLALGKAPKLVEITFDDTALGEEDKLGVKSEAWKSLSNGACCMPALAIDGVLYMECDQIVLKLAEDAGAPADVKELIKLSVDNNPRLFMACKHWGWSGLHKAMSYAMVTPEHYSEFGEGNKSAAWEAEIGKVVHSFFGTLESKLAAKPKVNGFFVGDSLTFADCALLNWYLTFNAIAGLNIEARYPNFAANWKLLSAMKPPGSEGHLEHFPAYGDYVTNVMKDARAKGFDINLVMPSPTGKEYLEKFAVAEKLRAAVTIVLKEKPEDPIKSIGEALLKMAV